jgi:hypothetical protein
MSNAVGPLGTFWRPAADSPHPVGIPRALFAVLLAVEAIALGLDVSFLLSASPW